jgi:hypothetical protein
MSQLIHATVLLLAAAAAAWGGPLTGAKGAAESRPPEGTWTLISKASSGAEARFTLELAWAGGKLGGRLINGNGDAIQIVDAESDGSQVKFRVTTGEGTFDVSGTVSGKQIKGTFKKPGGEPGSFTATKDE